MDGTKPVLEVLLCTAAAVQSEGSLPLGGKSESWTLIGSRTPSRTHSRTHWGSVIDSDGSRVVLDGYSRFYGGFIVAQFSGPGVVLDGVRVLLRWC